MTVTCDTTKKLFLKVSFVIDKNDAVCMTTVLPLTYISGGEKLSASAGEKITFPLNHGVVLCTDSVKYHRINMRVAKQPRPKAFPIKRARMAKTLSPTPPYDALKP
jgi:hypothetical protein